MFRYIVILILSIQAVSAQIDGCIHENFESAEQSAFSSTCTFSSFPIWEFKTYVDETLAAPPTLTSNGYINAQSSESCIAYNSDLNVLPGSKISFSYFATGSDIRLELYLIFNGLTLDVLRLTPTLNTWTTSTLTSTTTGSRTLQLVAHASTGSISVDSITFVYNAEDYETCFSDPKPVENTPEPEEDPELTETTEGNTDNPEESTELPEMPTSVSTPGHVHNLHAVMSIVIITLCLTILFIILRRRRQSQAAVPSCDRQITDVFPNVQPLPKEPPPQYELAISQDEAEYIKTKGSC